MPSLSCFVPPLAPAPFPLLPLQLLICDDIARNQLAGREQYAHTADNMTVVSWISSSVIIIGIDTFLSSHERIKANELYALCPLAAGRIIVLLGGQGIAGTFRGLAAQIKAAAKCTTIMCADVCLQQSMLENAFDVVCRCAMKELCRLHTQTGGGSSTFR